MADKEYIERGALLKRIFPYGDIVDQRCYSINAKAVRKEIQDAPAADVVEVVRCKDCKHRNPYGYKCLRDNLWHNTDDFCSHGERKEQT